MAGRTKEKAVKSAVKKTSKKAEKAIKTTKKDVGVRPLEAKLEAFVCVDFPRENDFLSSGHYAVRLGACANMAPEVSINGGSWQKCRFGAGFWWYDWSNFPKGIHKIQARICDKTGNTVAAAVRNCVCK